MSMDSAGERGLERLLANVLSIGTWLGSAAIAIGLTMQGLRWGHVMSALTCARTITAGIALFILLPILRVLLMAIAFVRSRDVMLGVMAIAVVAVIGLAAFTGMRIA
jgi:uncharacterized membrane protein